MVECRSCPNCGSELPVNAPQGLCPACLLRHGLDTEAPDPPHGEPTATGAPIEETVPGAGMTASHTPRPSGPSPDPTAANPVIPRGGPNGDEGSLEPGIL